MVRHCPRCELRFVTEGELREHLEVDHGAHGEALERYRYPPGPHAQQPLYRDLREEPSDGIRRYLVVANQSLGGEALTGRVRALVSEQPSSFYVVVPATHSADYPSPVGAGAAPGEVSGAGGQGPGEQGAGEEPPGDPGPGAAGGRGTDERGRAQAAWRLRRAIEYFRSLGIEARGEVGAADPLEAVAQALAREPADAVIVSTLPSALSRWLAADVPRLIARRFGLPVTTVVAEREPAAGA